MGIPNLAIGDGKTNLKRWDNAHIEQHDAVPAKSGEPSAPSREGGLPTESFQMLK